MTGLGKRRSAAVLGAMILSACGGGGSSGSSPAPAAATYTISGTISNLAPGSYGVNLALNEMVQGIFGTNGSFTLGPVPNGTYTISIASQPSSPAQTCTVSPATVTVHGANVNNISLTCTPTYYTISGVVNGIAGTAVTIATQVNGSAATTLALQDTGSFTYPTAVLPGATYNTSIVVQPSGPGFSAQCEFAPGTQSARCRTPMSPRSF